MKKTILVVDDEPMVTDFLTEFLSKEGYGVVSASDSREALLKVAARDFHLVIVDMDMARVNGAVLYDTLKETGGGGIPVIAMSAGGITPSLVKSLAAGADGFITKPSDIGSIRQKVRKCLKENA